MVRIVAGYTIEHAELVKFLDAQGWGPGPGKPELSPHHAWMAFVSWRCSQPPPEDVKKPLPRPQYWFDKDGNEVHAIMTRYSKDRDNWQTLRFKEMPIDKELRDKLIEQTGNVLDPAKMRFWSMPETYLYIPLGTPVLD